MAKGPAPYKASPGTHPDVAAAMTAIWNAYWCRYVPRTEIAAAVGIKWEDVIAYSWQVDTPNIPAAQRIVAWYKRRWPNWAEHGL